MQINEARLGVAIAEAEGASVQDMWRARSHQQMIERMAKVALGAALKSNVVRRYAKEYIQKHCGLEGYEYIGNGMEQTVFRKGSSILKVMHTHISKYRETPADTIAEKLQTESDICRSQLGGTWVPTDFDILVDENGTERIVAYQPFIDAAEKFHNMRGITKSRRVDSAQRYVFADQLEELHGNTGLHADILGRYNVLLGADRELAIVDTIPVDGDMQRRVEPNGQSMLQHIEEQVAVLRNS